MHVSFIKINPTKNMTVLVESPVPRNQHREVALALMDYGNVYAEQVGFIEAPLHSDARARLQMMGDEFCGNATLSLAAFLVWDEGLPPGTICDVLLESSGTQDLVACKVAVQENGLQVSMQLPLPDRIEERTFHLDGEAYPAAVVHLKGITHIILRDALLSQPSETFLPRAVRQWSDFFSTDACGIMLLSPDQRRIVPLVYVKSLNSLVWEYGCGTGTAATGAFLAWMAGGVISADIAQPGGAIHVDAAVRDGGFHHLAITGKVVIAARGVAYI